MSDLHKSEIARFREQQALEEEAIKLAFSSYVITARMQRGGERILQLIEEGKHEEAQVLMNSENWGIEEDGVTVAIGGERKNDGQAKSEPSANIGAQLQ